MQAKVLAGVAKANRVKPIQVITVVRNGWNGQETSNSTDALTVCEKEEFSGGDTQISVDFSDRSYLVDAV
jgi:hypothetical protein